MNDQQFKSLLTELHEWQEITFPGATALSKLYHLKQEVNELIIELEAPELDHINNVAEEYADCFILLFGSAMCDGYDLEEISTIIRRKFEIVKKRSWGTPDENGVVNHIKNIKP